MAIEINLGGDGSHKSPARPERLMDLENPGAWVPAEPRGRLGVSDAVRAINGASIEARRTGFRAPVEPTTDPNMAWDPERVKDVRYPFSA